MTEIKSKETEWKDMSNEWKVDAAHFTEELIKGNPSGAALAQPMNIFRSLLRKVGNRARQLNDPALNCLMIRLSIYEGSHAKEQNHKEVMAYLKEHNHLTEKL